MNLPDTGEPRRITHLEHDISTYDVRRKVVILAVEHDRDGVVAVHLIDEVIRVLGGVDRIGVSIGLVGRLPYEQIGKRLVRVDDACYCRHVLIDAGNGVNEFGPGAYLNRGSRAHVKDEIETQFNGPVDDLFPDGDIVVRRDRVNLFSESGYPTTKF